MTIYTIVASWHALLSFGALQYCQVGAAIRPGGAWVSELCGHIGLYHLLRKRDPCVPAAAVGSMQGTLSTRTLGVARQQAAACSNALARPRSVMMGVALRTKAPQVRVGSLLIKSHAGIARARRGQGCICVVFH